MNAHRSILNSDKLNLEKIKFMIVDDNSQSLEIIASAISGFGVHNIVRCDSAKEARRVVNITTLDFVVTDAEMPEESGYDLVHWIRREGPDTNRFVPIVVVTGHTREDQVKQARDCGAHFLVTKPVTPKVLLERIFWVARETRPFIECETYVGPDRRFKRLGPPFGIEGRRKDDTTGALGEAIEPNLSQDEINSFMKPAKVAL
jgi:CheY-like chemotaxis protein